MPTPLAADALRWTCDPAALPFDSTAELPPEIGYVGQEAAVEALRFGIDCPAPDQNVFVRGLTGSGRMSMVTRLLEEIQPPCQRAFDHCYVHNFTSPDRPRLITLAPGYGRSFRKQVRTVAKFVREDLAKLLTGEAVQSRREAIEAEANALVQKITAPFEADLKAANLAMVQQQQGEVVQTAIVPLHEGKPLGAQEIAALRQEDKVTDEQIAAWNEARATFAKRLAEISREVQSVRAEGSQRMLSLLEDTVRELLGGVTAPIREAFGSDDVITFLDELTDDVIDNLGRKPAPGEDTTELYDVNIVLESCGQAGAPVVFEATPTLAKLLGTVETGWGPQGPTRGDFRSISAGSMLRANGGFLLVEARDLLTEPGAWRVVVRALRTKQLEVVPPEISGPYVRTAIKPEPIPLQMRVILVGDGGTYHMLDRADPEFGQLFKVLADFDSEILRDAHGVRQYAGVIARVADQESLPAFDRTGIAALAEHGARIASRAGKLTARFSRIADIAREAAYVAGKRGKEVLVGADDVHETVRRTKSRADLASRRFHSMIANGTIIIETEGGTVGQVNGMAVIKSGMLTYGFPARITATISPGNAGIIDIESSASLSGQIHTKGFQILGGLLRHLLHTEHALAFSASLAFEQSYGGIDGDSASGAEICCLLSALTGVPLRQDVAMTGAIDQHGRIQAIGGVNEKIEGFFDACTALGMSGEGGAIIPASNAGDLMLRADVVEACAAGRFHIWAVSTVQEALEVFTGHEAGTLDDEGRYPEDSLLGIAQRKALDYWKRSLTSPAALARRAAAAEDDDADLPEA